MTLGPSCQLQFRQPAPPSATARLDLVSGHRLLLGVDGVMMMAETLILGAGPQVHVPVPDMKIRWCSSGTRTAWACGTSAA